MKIQKAIANDAIIIHELIHQIYYPTYQDILSAAQIDFMLERSYTTEALQNAMNNGEDFFILSEEGKSVGFIAVTNKDNTVLRIEKLYLLPETQGKGAGKILISFAAEEAVKRGKTTLELNVNRGNKAYYFYLKQGFVVTQEVDIPYFGYVLDDYVMQKSLY